MHISASSDLNGIVARSAFDFEHAADQMCREDAAFIKDFKKTVRLNFAIRFALRFSFARTTREVQHGRTPELRLPACHPPEPEDEESLMSFAAPVETLLFKLTWARRI